MISDLDGILRKLVEIHGKSAVRKALASIPDPNPSPKSIVQPFGVTVRIFNSIARVCPHYGMRPLTEDEWFGVAREVVLSGYPECLRKFSLRNFGRISFGELQQHLINRGYIQRGN